MSKIEFSDEELAFFAEGEALAEKQPEPVDSFEDLEPAEVESSPDGWARRALAVLTMVAGRG